MKNGWDVKAGNTFAPNQNLKKIIFWKLNDSMQIVLYSPTV